MKKILLLLLLFTSLKYTCAQNTYLSFDHLTIKDGLPEANTTALLQDDLGYTWIGTQVGLARYDGYRIKVYRFGLDKSSKYNFCSILSIKQGKDKTLWVSTIGNGLFRYDRAADKFIGYGYPEVKNEVFRKYISFIDKQGNVWLINRTYLDEKIDVQKFDIKTGQFESFNSKAKGSHYIKAGQIFQVYQTAKGLIWLGTSNGLWSYNPQTDRIKSYLILKDSLKNNNIDRIYEAPSKPGILWMNSYDDANKNNVVIRLNPQTGSIDKFGHNERIPNSIASASTTWIFEDTKKRLWFGTTKGLSEFNEQKNNFNNFVPKDSLKEPGVNGIRKILERKDGSLWLATNKGGLLIFNPQTKQFSRFVNDAKDPQSLASNYLDNIFEDRNHILWISTEVSGVDRLNSVKSSFQVYTEQPGVPGTYSGKSATVVVDPAGFSWFSTQKGIYKSKPGSGRFEQIIANNSFKADVGALYIGRTGNVFYGGRSGLVVYNPVSHSTKRFVYNPKDSTSITDNTIFKIYQDRTGLVWVGTYYKGICTLDLKTGKFKRYPYIINTGNLQTHSGELDDSGPISIYEDKTGTIWVGTNLGGLNRFNRKTGKFTNFLSGENRKMFCISDICEDAQGRLWVGSYLTGVFLFDRNKEIFIKHFDEQSGLLFNSTLGLRSDREGNIWTLSERGISRLNPQTNIVSNYPINYLSPVAEITNNDGMTIFEKTSSDQFLVLLKNGIALFNPQNFAANPYSPQVHIESVFYSNPRAKENTISTLVAYGRQQADLPWNQNRLTFNYIALHYANPLQNKYAYRLEGYNKGWIQAGSERSATYTNLSPGTYTFLVKASNSDGVWNNTGDSFTIVINSPWWLRWWACLLYLVLFGSALYAFIVYRSQKLIRENQLLEEKISLRTEQLNEQQKETVIQRDKLAETITELKSTQTQLVQSEKMASLGELTAGIAHEIQNPLNFVNNFSEVSREMMEELKEELDKGDTEEARAITADVIGNLEKIYHHGKRADNIVKGMLEHSRASTGKKELTEIGKLTDEYLGLAYHGIRAKDKSFNATLTIHLQENPPRINIIPQDIGRVLLNLFNNAFYAVQQKQQAAGDDYKPEVTVDTSFTDTFLEIRVKDNGTGIPEEIQDKILQPFFTTKPTGQGTGLGLSLSYDIIVKGHGGKINVESKDGQGSTFVIHLPIVP